MFLHHLIDFIILRKIHSNFSLCDIYVKGKSIITFRGKHDNNIISVNLVIHSNTLVQIHRLLFIDSLYLSCTWFTYQHFFPFRNEYERVYEMNGSVGINSFSLIEHVVIQKYNEKLHQLLWYFYSIRILNTQHLAPMLLLRKICFVFSIFLKYFCQIRRLLTPAAW